MTIQQAPSKELLTLRCANGETCYAIGTRVTEQWWVHTPTRTTRAAALAHDLDVAQSCVSHGSTGLQVYSAYNNRAGEKLAYMFAMLASGLAVPPKKHRLPHMMSNTNHGMH
jgi:hypothetical protein